MNAVADGRVRVEIRPGKFARVTPGMARALQPPRFEMTPARKSPCELLLAELQRLAEGDKPLPSDIALRKAAKFDAMDSLSEALDDLQDAGKIRHRKMHAVAGRGWTRVIQLDWCGTILRGVGAPEDALP